MVFLEPVRKDLGLVFFMLVALASSFLTMLLTADAYGLEVPEKINAKFFVGSWKCEAVDQAVNFRWEVELILDGQWLSGKTISRGVLQSVDIWKVESHGQPSLRRVFLADGSFVESSTKAGWKKLKLRSHGLLREKKRNIETRETLRWVDEKTFEAKTERKVEKKWIFHSKEICSKL
ncbi:MAG: hypothetical protein JNM39_07795 [Bdellovibrionaceae bacterium]|nr:hypothetical protein [Pseudobdellovibrionaceae bacterium]